MSMSMTFSPKIPSDVEAVQLSIHSAPEVQDLIAGTDLRMAFVQKDNSFTEDPEGAVAVIVMGSRTPIFAATGEWLVRDAAGIFRRYDPETFAKIYEPKMEQG